MSATQVMPDASASKPPKMAESYQSDTSIFAERAATEASQVM